MGKIAKRESNSNTISQFTFKFLNPLTLNLKMCLQPYDHRRETIRIAESVRVETSLSVELLTRNLRVQYLKYACEKSLIISTWICTAIDYVLIHPRCQSKSSAQSQRYQQACDVSTSKYKT